MFRSRRERLATCRLSHRLRSVLANGIERHNGPRSHVERQSREVNRTFNPSFAFDSPARPPVIPDALRQINASRPRAFLDHWRDQQIATPEVFAAELHRIRV